MTKSILVAALVAVSAYANAELIGFDDINTSLGPVGISDGYAGLNWLNFDALDGTDYPVQNGYYYGTISPTNVAFDPPGNVCDFNSDAPFTLESLYITSAWGPQNCSILGYGPAGLLYSLDPLLGSSPTFFNLHWTGVTQVNFVPEGTSNSTQIAIDNVDVTLATPEPVTVGPFAIMICGALLPRHRFRRQKARP